MYCTYLTIYSGNKLPPFYVGYVRTKRIFEKNYHGTPTSKRYSGIFKQEEKENPHLFKTKILSFYISQKEAKNHETKLLKHFDAKHNPMYINMSNADGLLSNRKGTKHTKATIQKMSKSHTGKIIPKKQVIEHINKISKKWLIIFPDGQQKIIKNLANFCRENNLCASNLRRWTHKGFKAIKI